MTKFFQLLILITLLWCLKFLVAWLMFLLATWLQVPFWMLIAMVAVGACETKITFKIG